MDELVAAITIVSDEKYNKKKLWNYIKWTTDCVTRQVISIFSILIKTYYLLFRTSDDFKRLPSLKI